MCALQTKPVLGHSTLKIFESSSCTLQSAPRQARQAFQSMLHALVGLVNLTLDCTHAYYQRLQCTACCSAEANVNKCVVLNTITRALAIHHGSRGLGHALMIWASACQRAASSR